MARVAPPVDRRSAADVAAQVRALLAVYVPAWRETVSDAQSGETRRDPLAAALIAIFGRFAEIILQRLNRVPEKNLLAFLDLLGEARLPPEPARVALRFSLAPGSVIDALVPPGTQVAAPPAEGEKEPVVFETERELVVTAAELAHLFVREPGEDRYAERSGFLVSSLNDARPAAIPVFAGDEAIVHAFYLGHDSLFAHSDLRELRLFFSIENPISDPDTRELRWEIVDGGQGIPVDPDDATDAFTHDGQWMIRARPGDFPIPRTVRAGMTSRWLRCLLLTPLTVSAGRQPGKLRVAQLPQVRRVTAQVELGSNEQRAEFAFCNQSPIDLGKDFFPFGERPKFGDCLYLAAGAAFAESLASVTLSVELTNPSQTSPSPIPPVQASEDIALAWEFWNGREWTAVDGLEDDTQAFSQSGKVAFRLGKGVAVSMVNGLERPWLRVRLAAGNYGSDAHYDGDRLIPASFAPPAIRRLTVDYGVTLQDDSGLSVVTDNDFVTAAVGATAFTPFQAAADARPTLYLGFSLPAARSRFPNRKLSLHAAVGETTVAAGQSGGTADTSATPLQVAWEYSTAAGWAALPIADGAENFTRSGLIEWLAPADIVARSEFGRSAYWLRARWEAGDYDRPPRLGRLLFNTTPAVQAVTVRNEILGSSDGSESQRFASVRAPLLAGERLEVREPELPPGAEQQLIRQASGDDAITVAGGVSGRSPEIWVRWLRVPDFYGSGPRDRHYVLDPLSGEIRFGDGRHGLIPPPGAGNLRLSHYRTGGGLRGNRPANTIVQLKTTVPYVDKVVNPEAASGGAEAETIASLLERAPRALRHGHRAVTVEDYEDLAVVASPEVARARCVPLYDLASDPDATTVRPGVISLIVVPRSTDARPLPSLALLDGVRSFLADRRIPTADLVVVAPEYVRVDVSVEVALASPEGASAVASDVAQALARFLHPLTGGLDADGWDFGRQPHLSDLYALLEAVPGVDHLASLQVTAGEERPGLLAGGRFLVHSGNHDIRLSFAEG